MCGSAGFILGGAFVSLRKRLTSFFICPSAIPGVASPGFGKHVAEVIVQDQIHVTTGSIHESLRVPRLLFRFVLAVVLLHEIFNNIFQKICYSFPSHSRSLTMLSARCGVWWKRRKEG
jgi:hypothetical protein